MSGTEENSDADPNIRSLVFNKGPIAIQWKKKGLFNKCVEQMDVHIENKSWPSLRTSQHTQKSTGGKSKTQQRGLKRKNLWRKPQANDFRTLREDKKYCGRKFYGQGAKITNSSPSATKKEKKLTNFIKINLLIQKHY